MRLLLKIALNLAPVLLLASPVATSHPLRGHKQGVARVSPPVGTAHRYAIEKARNLAETLVAQENLPGLSVAVGLNGQIIWAEGFGWANLEERVPVSPMTRFRIGSVSKLLTSTAVGLLYQQGRIDLDAPVQKYVPTFPEKRWPITTRELMAHTSGIRHYRDDEFLSSKHYAGILAGLEIFKNDPLLFKPGTQFHYSSYGWNLVGAVVQKISGEKFVDFIRVHVLAPAGMRHTVPDYVSRIVPHRTAFYVHGADGRLHNAPFVDESYKWPSGGYLSTPSDLVRFGFAILQNQLLSATTRRLLWTPVHLPSGKPTGRGLDWKLESDAQGRTSVGHNGGSVGGTTIFLIYPDQRMVIAVTSNISDAAHTLSPLAKKMACLFAPMAGKATVPKK